MRGDAAHESKPDPRRAPAPPVTTRRVHSDASDPGTASGRLPPFRLGAAARPLPEHSTEGVGPIVAGSSAPSADVFDGRAADPAVAPAWEDPIEPADEADAVLELEPVDASAVEAVLEVEHFDAADIDEVLEVEAEAVGEAYSVVEVEAVDAGAVEAVLDVEPFDATEIDEGFEIEVEAVGEAYEVLEVEAVDAGAVEAVLDVEPFDPTEIDEGFEIEVEVEAVGEAYAVLEVQAVDVARVEAGLDVEPIETREANAVVDVAPDDGHDADEILEVPLPGDAGESSAPPTLEASAADEPTGDDEPWDALGEALQVAMTRAAPPFAEDIVRAGDTGERAVIEESDDASRGPRTRQDEARRAEAQVADRPATRPIGAKPQRDGFTEDLAATLESLAGSLRARGFDALDDAFARGGRLEASLALFLAGYRAGRGE